MNYADRLNQSKEDKAKSLAAPYALQEAARLNLKIVELGLSKSSYDNKIEELKGTHPLNVDGLVAALDEQAWLDRQIAQLTAIQSELFGK